SPQPRAGGHDAAAQAAGDSDAPHADTARYRAETFSRSARCGIRAGREPNLPTTGNGCMRAVVKRDSHFAWSAAHERRALAPLSPIIQGATRRLGAACYYPPRHCLSAAKLVSLREGVARRGRRPPMSLRRKLRIRRIIERAGELLRL